MQRTDHRMYAVVQNILLYEIVTVLSVVIVGYNFWKFSSKSLILI